MRINVLLAILLLSIQSKSIAQTVYIIIHGTWTPAFNWHMPGGDFYQALQATAKQYDASVAFLSWSGENNHRARIAGAKRLVNLIQTYSIHDAIHLVAHSHGGNVAITASNMLANTGYTIQSLFLLGTPINANTYKVNMSVIARVYNLFSFGDMVQTVAGWYHRELPKISGCHNVRVEINEKHPNHDALHDPMIGAWIPMIEFWKQLSEQEEYLLCFKTGICPTLHIDTNRTKFREKINALLALYNDPLRKIKVIGSLPKGKI